MFGSSEVLFGIPISSLAIALRWGSNGSLTRRSRDVIAACEGASSPYRLQRPGSFMSRDLGVSAWKAIGMNLKKFGGTALGATMGKAETIRRIPLANFWKLNEICGIQRHIYLSQLVLDRLGWAGEILGCKKPF